MKKTLFNKDIGKVRFSTLGMKIGYFMNFSVPAMIEHILKNSLINRYGGLGASPHRANYSNAYRYYTTNSQNINNNLIISDITVLEQSLRSRPEFYEWFCGFTDGEGNFYFGRKGPTNFYQFFFQIQLHLDDFHTLVYIRDILGFGKAFEFKNTCIFRVSNIEDIKKIITIFEKYTLNSTKLLNFLSFKKAFDLYINSSKTLDLVKQLEEIKSGVNSKRTDYKLPANHEYRITNYWLLGFIEADGSFFIKSKELSLIFNISQSFVDSGLLKAIQVFLLQLKDPELNQFDKANLRVRFVTSKGELGNKQLCQIIVNRHDFIREALIPFLSSLNWQTKKKKDFEDWTSILMLRDKGFQYIDDGLRLIELIISQMNNRRLSSSGVVIVDREFLYQEINLMLNKPSNLEIRNGNTWIISQNRFINRTEANVIQLIDDNGVVVETFYTFKDCAKYLEVSLQTIPNRINKNSLFKFKDKFYTLKKAE
jgi:hypothetical protein